MTEYVGAIEKQALENTYFRKVLLSGSARLPQLICERCELYYALSVLL